MRYTLFSGFAATVLLHLCLILILEIQTTEGAISKLPNLSPRVISKERSIQTLRSRQDDGDDDPDWGSVVSSAGDADAGAESDDGNSACSFSEGQVTACASDDSGSDTSNSGSDSDSNSASNDEDSSTGSNSEGSSSNGASQ